MSIEEHKDDIDFRSREERSKHAVEDMKQWYIDLHRSALLDGTNERVEGQITMLSSVLWLLLPEKEFKALKKQVLAMRKVGFVV